MIRIYGCSDDLVEIEGSNFRENEINCIEKDVRIWFLDGTVIRIGYPKENQAVWWIKVENEGKAKQYLTICEDEDADIYSDIFEIDSEIKRFSVIDKEN